MIAIVTLIGAAGIYAFERELPNGTGGINDYGTVLWWTAMLMSTIGSDYFPKTPQADGVTSKLKGILDKGLSLSASKKICACDRDFFGGR